MRWRPTLAALAVLAVVGALAVAMSSASSPTVSASSDDPTVAAGPASTAGPAPAPTSGDVATDESPPPAPSAEATASDRSDESERAVAEGDGGTAGPDVGNAEIALALVDAQVPARGIPVDRDLLPTICPDPSDPFFNLYRAGENCYWLRLEDEQHQELTEEELALLGSVPFVPGYVAEPLGRPARKIRRGPTGAVGAPRLYLTFDDGPSNRWTRATLDLLERYSATATFFPVGAYAKPNFHLIEEIVARGHTIGVHLWSHEAAALASEDLFRKELRASADLFGDYGTNCLRTPYGITNDEILEWAGDEGFEVVLWGDVDPLDWQLPGIEELTRRILEGVRPGTILLLHERTGANTLAALDAVLGVLAATGWRFDQPICPLTF